MIRTKKFLIIYFSFLVVLNILSWLAVFDLNRHRFLEVIFFDVGQGDAIFIETPKRQQILIDGGPGSVILERLARAMPFYDRSLDLLILTHPHHDHLAGLLDVLRRYKIKNILWTGVLNNSQESREWERLIEKEEAEIKIARAWQKIRLIDCSEKIKNCQPVYMEIFHPFESLEGREFKNLNDSSIVSRLVFGESSFLFTGDVPKSVEGQLVSGNKFSLDSDILKISHHGSKNSSLESFILKTDPAIAIISSGKNNQYGYPHKEVLEILNKYGIKIGRTDLEGSIKIISDGKSYEFSNF